MTSALIGLFGVATAAAARPACRARTPARASRRSAPRSARRNGAPGRRAPRSGTRTRPAAEGRSSPCPAARLPAAGQPGAPARSRRRPHAGHAGSPGPGTAGAPQADARRLRPGPRRRTAARPHPHVPSGQCGTTSSGSHRQARYDPGEPGCPPALRLPPLRAGPPRGEVRPGRSSIEGGNDELPLFREISRSRRATLRARSAFSASSCAILLSRSASKVSSTARDNGSYPVTQPR